MRKSKAQVQIILAMAIFGTLGLFVRNIPLPSAVIAMVRGLAGGLLLWLVTLVGGRKPDKKAIQKNALLLLLSGGLIGFNWMLLFEAYRYTSVATATLCYYLAPVFITLASPLILKEKLTVKKLLCVLLALCGMVPVSGILAAGFHVSELQGVFFGVGAALLYATIILLNKKLTDISAMDRTMVQLMAAGAVMLPYVLLTTDFAGVSVPPLGWGMLAAVAVVHTGLAYVLYFGSLPHLSAQSAAMFSYIDPVLAVILSAAILRDITNPLLTFLGAALILGAAAFGELDFKGKKQRN